MGVDADLLAVLSLDAGRTVDRAVVGAKAAHLARAAVAGLPVLPGFVLVAAQRAPDAPAGEAALRRAWQELAGPDGRALVVRSSSLHEDTENSSMAGRYESVLDVRGWEEFRTAIRTVLDSARRVQLLHPAEDREPDPLGGMAVLVQPMLRAVRGGVVFGADPVAGRTDRVLVSAVDGGPDRLVDGSTQGVRYQLTRSGRALHTEPAERRPQRLLHAGELRRLARLAKKTRRVFGAPQDMEFGFDADDRLWLFQSRPITAMAPRPPRGARLLGPGPVAETFPGVLQPLEEDLWLAPMAHGLTLALDITGAAPRRALRSLPVVTTVAGRAVADLRLLGAVPPARPLLRFLNPAPGARRAAAAWRVGRLRAALPLLAADLIADVDRYLAELPHPRAMLCGSLLDAVSWGRTVLSALHAQESLAGALLGTGHGATAAGEALATLAEARARGLDDTELLARHPVVLTLLPPTLGERPALPGHLNLTGLPRGVAALPVREGLRLRIRWVQEMQAELIRELAARLGPAAAAGPAAPPSLLALRWAELVRLTDGGALPADLAERPLRPGLPALPTAFRLADGHPVAEHTPGRDTREGQGAGGGFGVGTAWDGLGERPERAVLVVRTLDPALAPLLPGLAGLVAETGSVLSHLAVLAREYGVPAAVGVHAAADRFPPGTELSVNGATGAVRTAGRPPVPQPAASEEGAAA